MQCMSTDQQSVSIHSISMFDAVCVRHHELNANISEEFQPFPLLINLLFTAHLLVVNNFKNLQKRKICIEMQESRNKHLDVVYR